MTLELISGPETEPVGNIELKQHLRLLHDAEDAQIAHFILAARQWLEKDLSLGLIEQSWKFKSTLHSSNCEITLPLNPLISVLEIRNGATQAIVDPSIYFVEYSDGQSRIVFRQTSVFSPERQFEIDFSIGYGSDTAAVPTPLKHAIILIASHWFEHREASGVSENIKDIPQISMLIQPFRRMKLS